MAHGLHAPHVTIVVLVAGKVHGRDLRIGHGNQGRRHRIRQHAVELHQFAKGLLGHLKVAMRRLCVEQAAKIYEIVIKFCSQRREREREIILLPLQAIETQDQLIFEGPHAFQSFVEAGQH